MHVRPAIRALARWITSPAACALWAGLLLLDWSSLPDDGAASTVAARHRPFARVIGFPAYEGFDSCPPPWPVEDSATAKGGPSAAKTARAPRVVYPYPEDAPRIWDAACYREFAEYGVFFHVYRTPDGVVALDQRTSFQPRIPWTVIDWPFVFGDTGVRCTGFWAPTTAVHRLRVAHQGFTASELAQLPGAIFRAVEKFRDEPRQHPVVYWLLRAARAPRTVVLPPGHPSGALAISTWPMPWGYVHNGVAAVIAVLLSVGIIRAIRGASIRLMRHRRRSGGFCPTCAYDLKFAFDAGCPECGWNRRASPPNPDVSAPS